jgi:cell division protein FtsI (penicillin-binding protein 3)
MILFCLGLAGQQALMLHDCGKNCKKIAESCQRVTIPVPAQPGSILLRNRETFTLAAISSQSPSCYVDPEMIDDQKLSDVIDPLGKALNMDPVEVQRIILSRRDSSYKWLKPDLTDSQYQALEDLNLPRDIPDDQLDNVSIKLGGIVNMEPAKVKEAYEHRRRARFVWLKRDISEEEVAAVVKLKKDLRLRAVDIKYEWRRHYPTVQLASSIIGFVNKAGEPSEGMEKLARHDLAAREGVEYLRGDVGRRFVEDEEKFDVPPRDGNNVYLTIDSFIQSSLEQGVAAAVEKHAARWGVGIVMNPNTGEVLAMCTSPTFDPNKFNDVSSPDARKNRCFTDPYEPGSAFKCIIAAAAVNAGMGITWQSRFNCEGGVYNAPGGGVISDHGSHYGVLTLEDIIVNSSNIGMAKVGEKLGNARLYEIVHRFGIGSQVSIQLPHPGYWPGGTAGIVREPLRTWDGYSLRRVPFGQEISVSAMQLANAYCALVNGGELLQPRLIDTIMDASGKKVIWRSQRKVIRRVISPQVSRSVTDVMAQVVERGTGKACKLDLWTSGGKTGTAQIAWKGTYPAGAFTSTFVGVAPVNKPALVCLISIYWPTRAGHFGAQVAAPVVKDVLEKSLSYMDVPPDRQPTNVADGR